jgi:hypothetical protein
MSRPTISNQAFRRSLALSAAIALLCVLLPHEIAKLLIWRFVVRPEGAMLFMNGPRFAFVLPVFWWFAAILTGVLAGLIVASRFATRDRLRRALVGDRQVRLISPGLELLLTAIYGHDARVPPGRVWARDIRLLTVLTGVLMAAIVGLTCLWAHAEGRSLLWRDTLSMEADVLGTNIARRDFRAGMLRLYELSGPADESRPTSRREGPFEVWRSFYFPDAGPAHQWERERFIAAYNEKMRYMQAHPAKFRSNPPPQSAAPH